jgi:hypothetical protein
MIRCILMLMLIGMVSCKSDSTGIMEEEKMKDILWDMAKAEALARDITQKDSSKRFPVELVRLTKEVFLIHHTNDSEFQVSYSWYTHHPDILEKLLDSMTMKQTRLHSKEINKNVPNRPGQEK